MVPSNLRDRAALLGRHPAFLRESVGRPGPVQLSSAPSIVITEPDSAAPVSEASRATTQPYSSTSPRRCSGTVAAALRHSSAGYCRSDSVAKRPIAIAATAELAEIRAAAGDDCNLACERAVGEYARGLHAYSPITLITRRLRRPPSNSQ